MKFMLKTDGEDWAEMTMAKDPDFKCGDFIMIYKGFDGQNHTFETDEGFILSTELPEGINPKIGDRFEYRNNLT